MERFEQLEARVAELESSVLTLMKLVMDLREARQPKRKKSRSRRRR